MMFHYLTHLKSVDNSLSKLHILQFTHNNFNHKFSSLYKHTAALFGNKHIPFASITFGAPSKTFNIAGIVCSYAIVPDENLRERFYGWLEANEFGAALGKSDKHFIA